MKILQINASYKPAYIYGGPTMSVSKLCEQLIKAGCTVEVFTTTANGSAELPVLLNSPANVDNVPVRYFKRITKDHSHFSPALLSHLWKKVKNFDVVHIHAWWNLVSVLSCAIALARGVKVVVSPRGTLSPYSFNHKNNFIKKLLQGVAGKKLLNKCYLHTTSRREQEAVNRIIHPLITFNIYNFIELPEDKTYRGVKDQKYLNLLFLSRIEEKKGLDILIKSLPGVTVPYHLTIAGDGDADYTNSLKDLAENKGVSENISWIGFQYKNKFDVYKQHDLFILPSHDENFGNVVIESLSTGTAVLLSENVGLADYVSKNDYGWICKPDELSISNSINLIFEQKDKLRIIREQAPLKVRHDFNEEKLVHQYMTMYNQIINNG